jgi:tetratricopeptide (TPR) repeat protein
MMVHIFEEHSSVLPLWWEGREQARTVIYLDAHLDLQHINDERIARLQGCQSVEQVRAQEKPYSLLPDDRYSYSLEDFLYPASRLGLLERLIWVAPPHVRTAYAAHAIAQLQQMDGVQPEDLYSFKKTDGGWIEGRILGLDIVICDYRHLEHIAFPEDSLIDIDIDYFITVPGDKAWVNPGVVFEALHRLPLAPGSVTLSRSVGSGFTPLRFRFIADYLAALWEDRGEEQAHYARLFEYEAGLRAGGRQAAASGLQRELERYPECAATWYLLGLAEVEAAEAARYRSRAGELSDAYRQNMLRSVCELQNRSLPVDLSSVLGMERKLDSETGADPMEQGLVWAALGITYCLFGELPRAMDCYQRASSVFGAHPELAMEIGKLLAASGRLDPAEDYLRVALQDDKSRTGAHFFISQIKGAKGQLDEAREHLLRASTAAPAWDEVIARLAGVHARLGNHAEAQACRTRCDVQRMQTARLLRQLAQAPVMQNI